MNLRFQLSLAFVLFLGSIGQAQIPGFNDKWRIDLGTTNAAMVRAIGRDGAVLVSSESPTWESLYIWISSTGQVIGTIPRSEFMPNGSLDFNTFVVVLVLNSNLVVQLQASSGSFSDPQVMQITQVSRSGSTLQFTKTQLQTPNISYSSARDVILSDFSCPQRLMFVQQETVLICYRPAADIATPLTTLTLSSVSQAGAELLVTSSQGGQVQLQGSTNLANWQSVTNIQTTPGVTKVVVPSSGKGSTFYRGKSE
jgi:hypothetical protein